jgi:hypothetical protein
VVGRKSRGGRPPEQVTSILEVHTSRPGGTEGSQGQNRFERRLHFRPMGAGSPRLFRDCRFSTSHSQHISHRITDLLWSCNLDPCGDVGRGYRCWFLESHASVNHPRSSRGTQCQLQSDGEGDTALSDGSQSGIGIPAPDHVMVIVTARIW